MVLSTIAAVCLTCPWCPSDAGVEKPCQLTLGGRPLSQVIRDPAAGCPEYMWPGADGIVEWAGRRWLGLSDALRWVFLFRWGRETTAPGCGCDVALKASRWGRWLDPWLTISPELRGRVAAAMAGWRETRAAIAAGG